MADFLSKARGIVEDLKDQELLYKAYIGNSNVKTEDIKGVVGEMRKLRDQLRGHIDTLRDDFSKNKLGAPHIPRGILRYLTHHDSGSGNRMGRRVFDSPFAGMRFGRDDGRSKNLYTDRGAPSNPSPNPGPAQDGGKPAPANPERGTSPGAHLGALVATPGDSQEGYYEDYTFDDSYSQGAYTDDAYAEDDY
jgi:hypothetical protein